MKEACMSGITGSIKMSPISYGNHNNLYFKGKYHGVSFIVVAFFDTEEAYVKQLKKNINNHINLVVLLDEIKNEIFDYGFKLTSKLNEMKIININKGKKSHGVS